MMLVETVTMTARAVSVPFAVSTARLRRVSIDFTGVDNCTVTPSASAASSAPRKFLAAAERAEHEFDCAAPVAEIVRHHLLARHVGLARRVVDGAGGAHLGGEEIFQLAFARIAPADADFLARRRRIDLDAAARRQLGQRIEVGRVDPMGTAVIGYTKRLGVGDTAAADMIGRLDQHIAPPGGGDAPRRGDAGGAGADDNDVSRGRRRLRRGRDGRTRR